MAKRVAVAVLSLAVCWQGSHALTWAYINGGVFHSTWNDFKKKLCADGWSLAGAVPRYVDRGAAATRFGDPVSPEFQRWVNQIVGGALKDLPEDQARALSLETKREIARLAREAISTGDAKGDQMITEGQIGMLEYQVGTFRFSSYWETSYGNRRQKEGRRAGLTAFVALKFTDGTP